MHKILVVDDHRIFTDGISFLLGHTTDLRVTGALHHGREVMPFLSAHPVDVLLLDIDMPDVSGFEIAKSVKQQYPQIKILALSMIDDIISLEKMYRAGADGYCVKSSGREEVFRAIRTVLNGGRFWPPAFLRLLSGQTEKMSEYLLTPRETEIIKMICEGVTSAKMAQKLHLSIRTVETHRKNIYRKLDVHSNVELANYARKRLNIQT
ncbi:Oxygen regulatory protein NreC [Dyadobacter sp. CECT 9275]|uniref:Oxygen regulatory protein NreC n=1 Tax=Dyadobacter helix TaxID=2822344 RepID=A0A916NDW6_9BACT|nr:response regulator transcription factor [Dyadobacter sp. CECT 9275]CAG5015885.1 Oxygen regulatory protein NreC [Dyadobacter sp. CECT 9275]